MGLVGGGSWELVASYGVDRLGGKDISSVVYCFFLLLGLRTQLIQSLTLLAWLVVVRIAKPSLSLTGR